MNEIQAAMVAAGIKVPMIRRVWHFISDHPGCTSTQICAGLKEHMQSISAFLYDLKCRKMVTMVREPRRSKQGRLLQMQTYTVEPSMRGVYELLPKKRLQVSARKQITSLQIEPAVSLQSVSTSMQREGALGVKVAPTPSTEFNIDVDNLTVREARALYLKLKEVFA